jgi:hypothetical protein
MDMPIRACSDELMPQAEALVRTVFKHMSLVERFSFAIIKNQKSIAAPGLDVSCWHSRQGGLDVMSTIPAEYWALQDSIDTKKMLTMLFGWRGFALTQRLEAKALVRL